ncbi:MAG: glycosyltransferase family 2 protein [Candidatus Aenigmatarchaeota archaeon]
MIGIVFALCLFIIYFVALVIVMIPAGRQSKFKSPTKVSVIIATKNEKNVIEKTLKALRQSDYPKNKLEIIVVDSSTDSTTKIARKYAKVIIDKSANGKPHALNIGVKKACGNILYFLDADSVVATDTIKKIVSSMSEKYPACIGINLPRNKNNIITRIGRLEQAFLNGTDNVIEKIIGTAIMPGRNFAIYKKTLDELGGFENVLTEDINLSFRFYKKDLKAQLVNAYCTEYVPDKLGAYKKQQERWMSGSISEFRHACGKIHTYEFILLVLFVFISGMPIFFFISPLFFLLFGYVIAIPLIMVILFLLFQCIKYLDKDDLIYFPVALVGFSVFMVATGLEVIAKKLLHKKIGWYKTPK